MFFLEKITAYFIEGFFMAGAGLGIMGTRLSIRTMLAISLVYALGVYSVRAIYIANNIPFGTHIFILATIYIALLKLIGRQEVLESAIATSASLLLILWGEGTFLLPLIKAIQFDPSSIGTKPGATLTALALTDIPLIAVFVICYVFGFTFIDLRDLKKN